MANSSADRRGCAEFRQTLRTGRRAVLRAGLLGLTGFGLADVLRAEGGTRPAGAGNPSLILLWMRGGPSHIDTWDPKPDAPAEIRGEFGVIPTKAPGVFLSDLLPMSAAAMDRWSIVRSLSHGDPGHSTADQLCFTGYPPGPNPDANIKPSLGSIAARQLGSAVPGLPPYVMIPKSVPGAGSAYLGASAAPFETVADPASTEPFRMPELAPPPGVSVRRLTDRRELRDGLDRLRREADADASAAQPGFDASYASAWDVLTSTRAAEAFDIEREPKSIRERYGLMPTFDPGAANRCGAKNWAQRMLLARRLIEAGVRVVTVDVRWWDTHVLGFDSLRRGFLPRWDRAFTALIEDLDARGLLASTLVVAWGEFGRTPVVNKDAGRDHYPNVFSAAFVGGGVKGGRVIGSSDSKGAFPRSNAHSPRDVLATIHRHLGVDTSITYNDAFGRPTPVLPSGRPIDELF